MGQAQTYTPGPWSVGHYGEHTTVNSPSHIIADMNRDDIIADRAVGNHARADKYTLVLAANARLMAAAPMLLDKLVALTTVAKTVLEMGALDIYYDEAPVSDLRAALADVEASLSQAVRQ